MMLVLGILAVAVLFASVIISSGSGSKWNGCSPDWMDDYPRAKKNPKPKPGEGDA